MTRAATQLSVWLTLSAVLGGCAFPLFNLPEREPPRPLPYRHARTPAALTASATASSTGTATASQHEAAARPSAVVGARPRSVLDPTPPEPSNEESASACHRALRDAGVAFERVSEPSPRVRWPIRFKGPVRGVTFDPMDRDRAHATLDCRLALALISWTRDLRGAGVRRVEYFSMYRPGARVGGDGPISGHAYGLAIDVARVELNSGVVLDVEHDWERRERGGAPCPIRRNEGRGSRMLRALTCHAADRKLFQIILTPHYNRAHFNHVHLERKPDVSWEFVH